MSAPTDADSRSRQLATALSVYRDKRDREAFLSEVAALLLCHTDMTDIIWQGILRSARSFVEADRADRTQD